MPEYFASVDPVRLFWYQDFRTVNPGTKTGVPGPTGAKYSVRFRPLFTGGRLRRVGRVFPPRSRASQRCRWEWECVKRSSQWPTSRSLICPRARPARAPPSRAYRAALARKQRHGACGHGHGAVAPRHTCIMRRTGGARTASREIRTHMRT